MEFIETFLYIIKYKQDEENLAVDALSQMHALLSTFNARLLGFEFTKELYANDKKFAVVYKAFENVTFDKFYRQYGYLFQVNKLYVPTCSSCELLIMEAHREV